MRKSLLLAIFALFVIALLSGCGNGNKLVKIGVTGSDGQYWNIIKEKAKKEGITIELVEFSDYVLPNKALADGDIDINAFQTIAFLNQFKQEHHWT